MGLVIMRNYSIKLGGEKRKGFRFSTGSGAYRVGKRNPFRFEKKRLRGPYSNEVAFESGMKRSTEPPFALALPHSSPRRGTCFFSPFFAMIHFG